MTTGTINKTTQNVKTNTIRETKLTFIANILKSYSALSAIITGVS